MLMLGQCRRLARQCRHYWTSTEPKKIIFSGIQPTGVPHLGNYLGAMKTWATLQYSIPESSSIYWCIVDLHSMTVPYDCDVFRQQRDEMWCALFAVGIVLHRCTVFEQSTVGQIY